MFELGPADPARVVETTEPIDSVTHALQATLGYRGIASQWNVEYRGSLFRNRFDTLTWDNPFQLSATNPFASPGIVQRGRFALAPDNLSHNLKVEGSTAIPWRGRITAAFSWTRMDPDGAG